MRNNASGRTHMRVSRATLILVAFGTLAACAVDADSSDTVFVIPPAELPALARDPGEALLLHGTVDGRMLLYVEQNQGARLTSFDVTDPVHIKGNGSIQLDAAGPFDFVAPLGDSAELVQFRLDRSQAVLNLPRKKAPTLMPLLSVTMPDSPPDIDPLLSYHLNITFDVKEIRANLTRTDTGTSFILTENGLYVARRPAMEWIHHTTVIPPN